MTRERKPRQRKPAAHNPWPDRLKAIRERLDLSQTEAAARCHISQGQWSLYESGARKPTRPVAYLIQLLETGKI